MKRNINSNRTQKWIKRNDLSQEAIRKKISSHCNIFDIEYIIKNSNESFILCIFIDSSKRQVNDNRYYEIYLDKEELALKTIYVNEQEKRIIKQYYKNDCWYKAIEDVVNMLYIKNN